jgi:hypothetical protein
MRHKPMSRRELREALTESEFRGPLNAEIVLLPKRNDGLQPAAIQFPPAPLGTPVHNFNSNKTHANTNS